MQFTRVGARAVVLVSVLTLSGACSTRDASQFSGPLPTPTPFPAAPVASEIALFVGTSPLVLDALPIDVRDINAIRPMGTLDAAHVLPSPDAIIEPSDVAAVAVRAMTDGVIIDIDRANGVISMRVRAFAQLRMSGFTLDSSLAIGHIVRSGDTLGLWHAERADAGIAVRVIDSRVRHLNWVVAERYGDRQSAAFFARYLADSVRSTAFGLVRRAAPDLDGRIDFDRDGRLVGTWFAPVAANVSAVRTDDALEQLARTSLSFVYDAERPGQVRLAAGAALIGDLGVSGVFAVAWDAADPATVDSAHGVVRYPLYPVNDDARIGRAPLTLLVQLVDSRSIRVEVVSRAISSDATSFSERAITLVR